MTKEEVDAVIDKYEKICEDAFKKAAEETQTYHKHWLDSPWSGFFEGKDPLHVSDTGKLILGTVTVVSGYGRIIVKSDRKPVLWSGSGSNPQLTESFFKKKRLTVLDIIMFISVIQFILRT